MVDIIPAYEYKDGRRSYTITGYRYVIVVPEHSLEKLGVKIEGRQLMEKSEGITEVEFSDLEAFVYRRSSLTSPPQPSKYPRMP